MVTYCSVNSRQVLFKWLRKYGVRSAEKVTLTRTVLDYGFVYVVYKTIGFFVLYIETYMEDNKKLLFLT